MATIESKHLIAEMLRNNGAYPGDPQASSIWSYLHDSGKRLCAVFMSESDNDLFISPYVSEPVLLWSKQDELTPEGERWLEAFDEGEEFIPAMNLAQMLLVEDDSEICEEPGCRCNREHKQ